jgi:carboxypeptidase C (cathepsin A)
MSRAPILRSTLKPMPGSTLSMVRRPFAVLAVLAVVACHVLPLPASAQDARPGVTARPAAALTPLPDPVSTSHAVTVGGRALTFQATASAIAIADRDGAVQADVAYTAYVRTVDDVRARPVVFAYNGGPGSASTWLHLGAMGPWRVDLSADVVAGRKPPELKPNAETWLDFADLVFIDPPGTGFSRIWPAGSAAPNQGTYARPVTPRTRPPPRRGDRSLATTSGRDTGGPAWFWSVPGDIVTFAEVIAAWLERNERKGSPVVLVGESYGGFRTPPIAWELDESLGIRVSAMVLVSPVLDFDGRRSWRTPVHHVALLPSVVATAIERRGSEPGRAALAEVESYAARDYLLDLMRGPRDLAAVQRMTDRLTGLAGLDAAVMQRHAGRISIAAFLKATASHVLQAAAVSIYDAGMAGLPPVESSNRRGYADPFVFGLEAPLTAAMSQLHRRLSWIPVREYRMMSAEVHRRWAWPASTGAPQVLQTLHELHGRDQRLRTLVTHGFTDLVTPYFASALQLDQLPAHGARHRIALEVYPGGHMFYSRDRSRQLFREHALELVAATTPGVTVKPDDQRRQTP